MSRQSTMYFPRPAGTPGRLCDRAVEHLRLSDEALRRIIDRVGPCTLAPRKRYFIALCEAIVSQQLAVKAAATIFRRFCALFDRHAPTPARLLQLPIEKLRTAGLSAQKIGYIRDLAARFADGTVPVRRLGYMDDAAVSEALIRVKGIGRWTAQMFLIFVLNRPDVWPTADLGIRRAVQIGFDFDEPPVEAALIKLAEPWRPYRSIAAWYLWQSLDKSPMKPDA